MSELYPVYVTLFSNNGDFSKLIKRATGSEYSHATISLDPSLNNMYSFTDIPFAKSKNLITQPAGFVRESIYGPMYKHNLYFTVLITFVDKKGFNEIQKKIDFFVKNHDKYRYNDLGLIKYFFNVRTKKTPDENKKAKWFCSEFVAYMLKAGGMPGIDTVMEAPQDLYENNKIYVESVDYTLTDFSEKDLIAATARAKQKFISQQKNLKSANESFLFSNDCSEYSEYDTHYESAIEGIVRQRRLRGDWNLMNYTTNIDWKYLNDMFIKYFGTQNLKFKFNLIELIIRKAAMIRKTATDDINEFIVGQFNKLHENIGNCSFTFIDMKKGIIKYLDQNKKMKYIEYPDSIANESYTFADTLDSYIILN